MLNQDGFEFGMESQSLLGQEAMSTTLGYVPVVIVERQTQWMMAWWIFSRLYSKWGWCDTINQAQWYWTCLCALQPGLRILSDIQKASHSLLKCRYKFIFCLVLSTTTKKLNQVHNQVHMYIHMCCSRLNDLSCPFMTRGTYHQSLFHSVTNTKLKKG